jgi:aminopeptidase N
VRGGSEDPPYVLSPLTTITRAMLSLVLAMSLAAATPVPPEPGVSEALARERASAIKDLRYEVTFVIPSERSAPVRGSVTARFTLAAPTRVVLDFPQPRGSVQAIRTGSGPTDAAFENGHIVVAAAATRVGLNELTVDFTAGDESLNRNDEFLYTLFVPARAQLAFPCFDQPDLKARYQLTLEVPSGWQAIANGAETTRQPAGASHARVTFAETQPLPTYLFAFAAGRFSIETATRDGRALRLFHRETDAAKVARNRDAIFDLHARALDWMQRYTEVPYPFGKFDIVLIPSFQFTGMEHPGAILYNASSLLLDESATQTQKLDRASVIAHETSHMWFGDLVTMRWFNDVWMKEVFANFMAAKIVNPSFPELNHELRFLLTHYPSAYQVDRTAGTNAIRQQLTNLNEAGQLYGPIIYQKAPIVMRQLEMLLGETGLRDGLRDYLRQYSFGNATWLDLVRLLDARTPTNLANWSRAWVEERGRPRVELETKVDSQGRVSAMKLVMSDPLRRGLVWPQRLKVAVGQADGIRVLPVDASRASIPVTGAVGLSQPTFVLPNGEGLGYGLFLLDDRSRDYLLAHVEALPDPLTRGSAWVTLWDNLLEARIMPAVLFDTATRAVAVENDEQNVERILGYLVRTFWRFLPVEERSSRSTALEALLRSGLEQAPTMSRKAAWFNALRDTALTPESLEWLERVWRRQETVPGLPLAEQDEIALALEIAVRDVPRAAEILQQQHERTQNPDRKARFAFVMPALSSDPAVREQAFERFRDVQNRRREPWVVESLRYLNHPLREAHAFRFLRPSLDLLREIQRTGDIFFPTRWTDATLSGHRSPDAAAAVRRFLAGNPQLPERLRWTVLVASDELMRAAR